MALGILLVLAAIGGLAYGILKKQNALTVASAIVLAIIAAIAVYFNNNPY